MPHVPTKDSLQKLLHMPTKDTLQRFFMCQPRIGVKGPIPSKDDDICRLVQHGDVEQPKPSGPGGIDQVWHRDKLNGTLALPHTPDPQEGKMTRVCSKGVLP